MLAVQSKDCSFSRCLRLTLKCICAYVIVICVVRLSKFSDILNNPIGHPLYLNNKINSNNAQYYAALKPESTTWNAIGSPSLHCETEDNCFFENLCLRKRPEVNLFLWFLVSTSLCRIYIVTYFIILQNHIIQKKYRGHIQLISTNPSIKYQEIRIKIKGEQTVFELQTTVPKDNDNVQVFDSLPHLNGGEWEFFHDLVSDG